MEIIPEKGRPQNEAGRLPKEIRVYDLLDRLDIPYDRADSEAAFTMEQCEVFNKALAPAVMCKNLMLCNSRQTAFYLLMIKGEKKFKTKEISRQIGSARLSFAPGNFMEELLDITPGSLSVLGLMNDKENRVRLLIDSELLKEELVGVHPCVNTTGLRLRTEDLLKSFLPAVGHDYTVVTLTEEA